MVAPASSVVLAFLNFLALVVFVVAGVVSLDRFSAGPLILLAGGAGAAAVVLAGLVARWAWPGWFGWRDRVFPARWAAAIALAPWFAVVAATVTDGLWWTQRPGALRALVWILALNWLLAWSSSIPAGQGSRPAVRTIATLVAAISLVLGLQGLALGLTPFGVGVSAVVSLVGAVVSVAVGQRRREAQANLTAAILATAFAVGVLEVGVRVTGLGANLQETANRDIARQFYTLTPPGAAFVVVPTPLDEFPPALIETNSLGTRGPELPATAADVLLIGDSFVEARQLSWEETVGPRFQEALEARGLDDRVVSHGMRGWSPLLEWNWYLKVGRRFEARTVVLFFFWNDLWTEGDEVSTFSAVLTPDERPDYFDVRVEPPWMWYHRIRTLRLAEAAWRAASLSNVRSGFSDLTRPAASTAATDDQAIAGAMAQAGEPPLTAAELDAVLTLPLDLLPVDLQSVARSRFWPGMRHLELWTDQQRQAAAAAEVELQRFASDVAADGGRLVILYVPNPLQVGPRECAAGRFFDRVDAGVVLPPDSGVQAWLRGVGTRHDIEILDPSDAMRNRSESSGPLYLRADCHWSTAGHQFVADWLAEWYRRTP